MSDVAIRAALVLGLLTAMPLIAYIAIRIIRNGVAKKTKRIAQGATDAAAHDWVQAPDPHVTHTNPTEAIPLGDWSSDIDNAGENQPTVFGTAYLPTREPKQERGKHRASTDSPPRAVRGRRRQ